MKRRTNHLVAVVLSVIAVGVGAETIKVPADATGNFGMQEGWAVDDGAPLVRGYVFAEPGSVNLSPSGTVDYDRMVAGMQNIPPEGTFMARGFRQYLSFLPLEEAQVNQNGFNSLPNQVQGPALMGAFVPASVAAPAQLRAWSKKEGGDVSPEMLFAIGAGPKKYTAKEAGTLLLGINFNYPTNAQGHFLVEVVTEP